VHLIDLQPTNTFLYTYDRPDPLNQPMNFAIAITTKTKSHPQLNSQHLQYLKYHD
jgi:hypothetical protein